MRLEAPKGTRDALPAESVLRDRVVAVAARTFANYGYGHITTPTFEATDLFVRGVGTSTDIVRKEMYTFTDGGGRSMTLRPEGTAPVVRAFVEHGMHKTPLPAKLWYHAPMFRYEAPQAGRFREHWQIGAEAIGADDPLLDAEVIALLAQIFGELGVPGLRLRIGSMGDVESRTPYRAQLLAYLERHSGELSADARARMGENPMRLFDAKDPTVQAVMAEAPRLLENLLPAAAAHHATVLSALDAVGIAYDEDPTLVRGMDYYTKTVFEFTCDRLGAQSGIGGGGRYDGLVEDLGGPPTPGIGFGAGVERIVLALGADAKPEVAIGPDLYFVIPERNRAAELFPMITRLRARGISCEMDHRGRSLKAMMKHAASLNARQAVIVGEREVERGVAVIRQMGTGDQTEVSLTTLEETLT